MPSFFQNQRILSTARSAVPPENSTALDVLAWQGATVMRAFSVRKVRAPYAGPCCRLRGNGTGSPEADIPFAAGALDKAAVATLVATGSGTAAFWKTFYDQSSNATDATQTSTGSQPQYSEAAFATGAIGGRATAQTNCWLGMNLGTLPQPAAFFIVFNNAAPTTTLFMAGNSTSSCYLNSVSNFNVACHFWGVGEAAGNGPFIRGANNALFVSNGAASSIWINGTQAHGGNTGGTQLDMSTGRIGMAGASTSNWLANPGNAIAELIVFSSDPTGLPGWSAFVAGARSYFGTL